MNKRHNRKTGRFAPRRDVRRLWAAVYLFVYLCYLCLMPVLLFDISPMAFFLLAWGGGIVAGFAITEMDK